MIDKVKLYNVILDIISDVSSESVYSQDECILQHSIIQKLMKRLTKIAEAMEE